MSPRFFARYAVDCVAVVLAAALISGCGTASKRGSGKATVVWISIDGFRHDYLDRAHPPFLSRLAAEGALTRELVPIFPSSTFPNHVAQACGTKVDGHGIPNNSFYDRETAQRYSHPDDSALLRAEPIWITAKRQGVRTVNTDWPVSQKPSGEWRVDYAPSGFDNQRSDQARLDETLQVLREDQAKHPDEPIRFVMSYIGQLDGAGHRHGPDSPEVDETLRRVDGMVRKFHAYVVEWFEASDGPEDELYVLFTTDHGMETVHTQVSLERLIGADLLRGVRVSRGATLMMLYFDAVPAEQRADRAAKILAKLKNVSYVRGWRAEDMPERLGFSDRSRVGDVMISLSPGFLFTDLRLAVTAPMRGGNLGAHGYDAAASRQLLGTAILWRYRRPLGGLNLGRVENTQWHAFVAGLLEVRPADGSDRRPIRAAAIAPRG